MFRKHIVLWTALLVVAVLAGTSAIVNAQRGERRRGFGPYGSLTFGVELTQEQRDQIRAIVTEERQQRSKPDGAADINRQLDLELLADVPDLAKVDSLRAQMVETHQSMLQKRIEMRKRVAEVLTPEQRAQARENLAKRGDRPGRQPR